MGPVQSDVPVRTIEREELRQKLARGDNLKLVMCLNEWAFLAKRIPGSIHFNTPAEILAGLQKDDEIVVYCTNPECLASLAVYHRLADHGYTNVRRGRVGRLGGCGAAARRGVGSTALKATTPRRGASTERGQQHESVDGAAPYAQRTGPRRGPRRDPGRV
jgi:rhodanese-related sulfurtransferase